MGGYQHHVDILKIQDVWVIIKFVKFKHLKYIYSMTVEQVAQVAHEINKAYCQAIGDTTHVEWEKAPYWQRDSAVHGVDFHLNNPDATPELSHEVWCREKAAQGWKYGPVKDIEKKEHPCFCLYSELPLEHRIKDHLFKQVVDSLKPYIGV